MMILQNLFLMAGQEGGNPMGMFVMMGAVMIVFYFFMIRPQSKKAKEQKTFLDGLKKGDKVVTIGGIHGKILKVGDDSFLIEVDSSTKLKIEKSAVSYDFTKAAGVVPPNNKEKEVATVEEK